MATERRATKLTMMAKAKPGNVSNANNDGDDGDDGDGDIAMGSSATGYNDNDNGDG